MKNYLIGFFIILIIVILFNFKTFKTYFKLKKEVIENKEFLNFLQKKSGDLQYNIKKLESNDLEYLDELARDKHDMSKPDEIIIFNNK